MKTEPYDCAHRGHVWLEADGKVYLRHRDRTPGLIAVHCAFCPGTAELQAFGKATAPPRITDPARQP